MTIGLPIIGHDKPCLINEDMETWFVGKELFLDDKGVYYSVGGKKYYVHDQVMIVAVKRKLKDPLPREQMCKFVIEKADPSVRVYFFRG